MVLLGVAVLLLLVLYGLSSGVRISHRVLCREAFMSGLPVREHAVSRFHVRWYLIAIVFVVFDMEMVFMYPWVLVVRETGAGSVVEMFAFLAVLVAAVIYAWREGVFRWT
ncbi:NADH-quinone oxidoreductase subunit A [Humibacter ginsenosidimutans]|uniref:NADH-quinone oxidoreductase subunit n=1 Tax=Humibacter ginsenosidimutans TaxID=2599293 RepID=A0A5B8M868_9MICO|nr:NADH-quinone oxidoreductase subunit A [Humibacter albus]QDZ16918.1 NADH-quinone oxidoreductase subunit A [Humibacter ginsenosidimutans]